MELGRPAPLKRNKLADVSIAKPRLDPNNMSAAQKKKYMQQLTGYKEDNKIFVDGEKHNKMGKNEFLKLLTFQLKNQDPMKPMEQGKMAGELAQFSQLEQLTNLNTKFEGMGKDKNIESKFYGASFLGKEVVTNGSGFNLENNGDAADILFHLDQPASKVLLKIYDDKNAMVGEVWRDNVGKGNQTLSWDGVQLDGAPGVKGDYRAEVVAFDQDAQRLKVETKTKGTVESIFFENGETVLKVDGKKVYLRDVDSFHLGGRGKFNKAGPKNVAQAFAGVEQKVGKNNFNNNVPQNLPVAQNDKSNVRLNEIKKQSGINTYNKNSVGTGITNIYDTE
jgi:flagellar basal-body rod modification protein FlgD